MKGKDILEKIYIEKIICEESLDKDPKSLSLTIGVFLWKEITSYLSCYFNNIDLSSNNPTTLYGIKITIDYDDPYHLSIGYCF